MRAGITFWRSHVKIFPDLSAQNIGRRRVDIGVRRANRRGRHLGGAARLSGRQQGRGAARQRVGTEFRNERRRHEAAGRRNRCGSAAAMVPAPWFIDLANWCKAHPDADVGLELTLNSELPNYRLKPVSSTGVVPSLVGAERLSVGVAGADDGQRDGRGRRARAAGSDHAGASQRAQSVPFDDSLGHAGHAARFHRSLFADRAAGVDPGDDRRGDAGAGRTVSGARAFRCRTM